MSYTISTSLAIVANPPAGAEYPDGTLQFNLPPRNRQYPMVATIPSMDFVGATDVSILPAGFTKVEYLYVRVQGGNLTFQITTAAGATQVIPCDDTWLYMSMTQPITALSVSGTGQVEMLAAGE